MTIKKKAKKAIILIRSLPAEILTNVSETTNQLMLVCEENDLTVIKTFYYQIDDYFGYHNIQNFIQSQGEKIAVVTNDINTEKYGDSPADREFRNLVQLNIIDLYVVLNEGLAELNVTN